MNDEYSVAITMKLNGHSCFQNKLSIYYIEPEQVSFAVLYIPFVINEVVLIVAKFRIRRR